jgi:hypothetical protein
VEDRHLPTGILAIFEKPSLRNLTYPVAASELDIEAAKKGLLGMIVAERADLKS